MNFFGFFKEQIDNYEDNNLIQCYDSLFAKYYDALSEDRLSSIEERIYLKYCEQASKNGKNVLELASGTGRVTINMAKYNCNFTCIEKSTDMNNLFKEKIKYSEELRHRIKILEEDVFCLEITDKKFDLIILPATTISILAVDNKKLIDLFHMIYRLLNSNGVFIFDYGINIYTNSLEAIKKQQIFIDSKHYTSYSQTFYKEESCESILNIMLQDESGNNYLSSTSRKVLSISDVYEIIDNTEFNIKEEVDDYYSSDSAVRFVVLGK